MLTTIGLLSGTALGAGGFMWVTSLRRVVPTNIVHIVQSAKKTVSYGAEQQAGNVYYDWPSWIPVIGVTTVGLPVSNFDLKLQSYKAYDIDRVPFRVDVTAFFRIADTNLAAQRVESYQELYTQLEAIVQGAVRTILASHKIDNIMLERSTFGEAFTKEVSNELKAWGVVPVKNMELMDIEDADESQVIQNIMAKKKSFIEMESRTEVAENNKRAEIAEIEADRETAIQREQAAQAVGERTAEKDKAVGIANEQALQEVKQQQKTTKEKEMAVLQVQEVRKSEIEKEVNIVRANANKETTVIMAQGQLDQSKLDAEGILVDGKAKAEAERLMLQAPVDTQISLAKEIGENEGYQQYLVSVEAIKANQAVGIEQAKALTNADLKVIANTGDVKQGVDKVMNLFSPQGGTALAGMAEAFAQTDQGKAVMEKLGVFTSPSGSDSPKE